MPPYINAPMSTRMMIPKNIKSNALADTLHTNAKNEYIADITINNKIKVIIS